MDAKREDANAGVADPDARERRRRGPSGRRVLWTCLASLVAGILLVEVAFRWLLFGRGAAANLGQDLRRAVLYADPASEDDFWKLFLEFDRIQPPILPDVYHPELGWISPDIARATLRHRSEAELGGRRPVLLYGDSFARCMGERADCFETLLADSDLADRYVLLNHGVQGYGLDQVHLLIERTVDRYLPRDPVVVVALNVDDSLDRTILSIRGWPKPRLRIRGDALELETTPVPSMEEYLARNPKRIRSYAWRYLLHGAYLLPKVLASRLKGEAAIVAEKREIDRRILEALLAGLRARGCEHYFLVFQGEPYLDGSKRRDWRQDLLEAFFRERSVPFTSAGRAIREDAQRSGRGIGDYFSHENNETRGHLLPVGNAAAFGALRDGLEKRFETLPP